MNILQAKDLLKSIVKYNLEELQAGSSHKNLVVPFFAGDPGLGKTAIPTQVAEELGLAYMQTIVGQFDPGELAGLPFMGEVEVHRHRNGEAVVEKETRMIRLRPSYLPDINDDRQKVGIYNLDELPQAMLAGQNVMSQLVNEYRIGEHQISRGLTLVATGNKPENKAGTTPMPSHLKDRLTYIVIEPDEKIWLEYAALSMKRADGQMVSRVDSRIRAYIRQNSTRFHVFDPAQNANPTPRSWEKSSAYLRMDLPKEIRFEAIAGQIGQGAAGEFEAWLRVEGRIPRIEDILARPDEVPVFGNQDHDVAALLLANLADQATHKNIEPILRYITRFPNKEMLAVFSQDCFNRDRSLLENKHVTDWKMKVLSKVVI